MIKIVLWLGMLLGAVVIITYLDQPSTPSLDPIKEKYKQCFNNPELGKRTLGKDYPGGTVLVCRRKKNGKAYSSKLFSPMLERGYYLEIKINKNDPLAGEDVNRYFEIKPGYIVNSKEVWVKPRVLDVEDIQFIWLDVSAVTY